MKTHFARLFMLGAVGSIVGIMPGGAAWAQEAPLLQITTIAAAPGNPVQFTFNDSGTGATNYLVEFAPSVGPEGVWSNITSAVVQSLGGGNFRVHVPEPPPVLGFFRVRGYGGAAGIVSASFNSTALLATEGGVVLPTITFSAPYHGIVRYTISGTATSGDYVTLSGEVFVNGTTATIPVSLLDNQSIGELRYLTLTLQAGPGLQPGGGGVATITIDENDADWQGSFISDDATIGFVLRLRESSGVQVAGVRGGGLGFFPTNETPASITFSADFFSAIAPDISSTPSATLLNSQMLLTLSLAAMNGVPNQSVTPSQIEGAASLVTSVAGRPHLATTNQGSFLLFKPPVAPSTNEVQLTNVP